MGIQRGLSTPTMKILPKHLEFMKQAITPILESKPDAWREYRELGRSAARFNWDIARSAGLMPFICDTLYVYANDSHIEAALRKITQVR